jgi:hypothetical protein
MKVLLREFSAKVCREVIFRPAVGNKNLYGIRNTKGVGVANADISKILIVKNTVILFRHIHKFMCIYPHGNTQSE